MHARELPLVHWVMHLLMIQPRYEELAGFFLHNLLVKGRFQFRLDETRRRAVADWAAVLDFWGSDITRSGLLGRAGRSCPGAVAAYDIVSVRPRVLQKESV